MAPKQDFHGAAKKPGSVPDSPAEMHKVLKQNLASAQVRLRGLDDPEHRLAGAECAVRMIRNNCKVALAPEHDCLASYQSFSLHPARSGFINTITYGAVAAREPERLFAAMVHESAHAQQKRQAAALHASPFNPASKIIICPRDWMLLEERCEQDAYTRQVWMSSLLAQQNPGLRALKVIDSALEIGHFEALRQGDTLGGALRRAAEITLHKSYFWDNPDSPYRFVHHAQDHALQSYARALDIRHGRGEDGFVFVRALPEDIHAIGRSFGPNVFGDDPSDPALLSGTKPLPDPVPGTGYAESTSRRLEALNARLGIGDEDRLPTLGAALAASGMTLERFMAHSMRRRPGPAAAPAP